MTEGGGTSEQLKTTATPDALHAPYYKVILDDVDRYQPTYKNEVRLLLNDVDRQSIANTHIFASQSFPDTSTSYTHVSVNQLVDEAFGEQNPRFQAAITAPKDSAKKIHVILSGIGGNAFTPGDILYAKAVESIAKVTNPALRGEQPPDVAIYSIGLPLGKFGTVSETWNQAVKHDGFAPYGQLYKELLEQVIPNLHDENVSITIHGMSLGSNNAVALQEAFGNNVPQNMRFLLDNAASIENTHPLIRLAKGVQMGVAFGLETAGRLQFDNRLKKVIKNEPEFYTGLQTALDQQDDTKEQKKLKGEANRQDALNLTVRAKGKINPLVRTYQRSGLFDPTTFSIDRIRRAFRKKGGYQDLSQEEKATLAEKRKKPFKAVINESHYINRSSEKRIARWAKNIDQGEKLKQSFEQPK